MSAFKPPSGRKSRGSETETQTSAFSVPQPEPIVKRQSSFSGGSRRASESGRGTPKTGVRPVNRVMEQFNREIGSASAGRRGLIVANIQSELESMRENVSEKLKMERKKLSNMKTKPKTPLININKQEKIIKNYENRLRKHDNAMKTVLGQKGERRNSESVQTKSTEEPPKISTKQRTNVLKPKAVRTQANFLSELKRVTGKLNRSRETVVETQAPPQKTSPAKKQKSPKKTTTSTQTLPQSTKKSVSTQKPKTPNNTSTSTTTRRQLFTEASNNNSTFKTPNQPTPNPTQPPSIKRQHNESKKRGSEEHAKKRRERWEREGPPAIRKALEPIFNKMAKSPKTPPGITKTNLERLFQPFKQPVTVTVAPTISVKGGSVQATGGSAKQGIVMLASNATKKKKKTPPPKPQYLKTPGTIRREKEKARSIAVRKQVVASMRTPTKGQRKTHVIQLIDRVLRKMKAPKDTEKKLIKLYESLSEKQIKSLFGGRSPEFVKKTLKKQVEYLKKKR